MSYQLDDVALKNTATAVCLYISGIFKQPQDAILSSAVAD